MIYPFKKIIPSIHRDAFVWPTATVIGNVSIGKGSSFWPGVVARGDVNSITIGMDSNIQDGSILYVTKESMPLEVGDRVTVGHKVTLHSCKIEDDCLIGMDAVILDNAIIGKGSFVAAGSVVIPNTKVPPGSFVAGSPAVVKGPVSKSQFEMLSQGWKNYVHHVEEYSQG